jgi:hypothetical protein
MLFFVVTSLTSLQEEQFFKTLKDLILRVNKHVKSRDYAFVLSRIKKFKLQVTRKVWLICDRESKIRKSQNQKRRHINSRIVKCSFFLIVKRDNESDIWFLKIANEKHNHEVSLINAHLVLRRIIMNEEVKVEFSRESRVQTTSSRILFSLRISDSIIEWNNDFENSQSLNSMFKRRDIYNLKAQMRRDTLNSLTLIQALIQKLNKRNWLYAMQKNNQNWITHLFFVRDETQASLKTYYEVLIMNCTYKTNRYRMSLMIINE